MADDAAAARVGLKLDTTVSHSARIWNYWLGGKDNFAVDREAGDRVAAMLPSIVAQARADRAFLGRAIRYLAGEAGIRQFLDIGTGLPTADNTHEVAQRVAPESRIVYADNDPLVLSHARALLTSSPEGVCDYIDGDLREPDKILAQAARTLDFTRPVALMLLGILHHISDTDLAYSIVQRLMAALAPGSFLAINHSTSAVHGAAMEEAVAHWNQVGTPPMTLRSPQQIARFFDGLDLLEPGVVSCSRWRPALSQVGRQPAEVDEFCGVAANRDAPPGASLYPRSRGIVAVAGHVAQFAGHQLRTRSPRRPRPSGRRRPHGDFFADGGLWPGPSWRRR